MTQKNLATEIVRIVEAGIDRHLNRSIVYSPFRLFYNLFKKNNPQTMNRVRTMVSDDIGECLNDIKNFDANIFISNDQITPPGTELLRICYNIGINLMKKELTVVMAFKALRSIEVREKVYNYVLEQIINNVTRLVDQKKLDSVKS